MVTKEHGLGEGTSYAAANGLRTDQIQDSEPVVPPPAGHWHNLAKGWYNALAMSGQAKLYATSDWAMAYVGADLLDELIRNGYKPASLFAEWSRIASKLLTTESDRRSMRVNLIRGEAQADPDEAAAVVAVDSWQRKLGAA
jgi:hypothetical protein